MITKEQNAVPRMGEKDSRRLQKVKDNLKEMGNEWKSCEFYEQTNCILKDRPSTKPAVVLN